MELRTVVVQEGTKVTLDTERIRLQVEEHAEGLEFMRTRSDSMGIQRDIFGRAAVQDLPGTLWQLHLRSTQL